MPITKLPDFVRNGNTYEYVEIGGTFRPKQKTIMVPADLTELRTVQVDNVGAIDAPTLAGRTDQQGDELLNAADGRTYKLRTGGDPTLVADWEAVVSIPRKYADEAARLARTGFTPRAGESFYSGIIEFRADDATPETAATDERITNSDGFPIVRPGNNGLIQKNKESDYFDGETPAFPTWPDLINWPEGSEYAIGTYPAGLTEAAYDALSDADKQTTQAEVSVTHWRIGKGGFPNQTKTPETPTSSWVFSTASTVAKDGDKIVVAPDHDITFDSTTNLESIQLAPSTGNWDDIAAGTGSFIPDAGFTWGNNQSLLFSSDIITAIVDVANTNILLLSGGDSAPELDARYLEVADLPAPATVQPGAAALVYGETISNLNGHYTAHTDGVDQNLAVAWVKG